MSILRIGEGLLLLLLTFNGTILSVITFAIFQGLPLLPENKKIFNYFIFSKHSNEYSQHFFFKNTEFFKMVSIFEDS